MENQIDPGTLLKVVEDFVKKEYELCGKIFVINFEMLYSEKVSELFSGFDESELKFYGLTDREFAIKMINIHKRFLRERKIRKLLSLCLVEKGKSFNEEDRINNEDLFLKLSSDLGVYLFQFIVALKYHNN